MYGVPWAAVTDTDAPLPFRVRRPRGVRGFVSPAVRRLAAQHGVDVATLPGTGASGRVTRADVEAVAAAGAPVAARGDEVVPFGTVRRRAAAALAESKRTAAHALCVAAVDYSAVDAARLPERARWRAREGFSLTYLPFVARAVTDALRRHPELNATVVGEAVTYHRDVHLGIAVDLDFGGLVVPVVRGADGLRLRALARAIHDVASRARARRLSPDDLAGGTFTITNPGAAGTWTSFPIINRPQVAIVSTDGVSKQVVADERGALRIAPVGHLCLAFDHRVVDAPLAGAFLRAVADTMETRDWLTEL